MDKPDYFRESTRPQHPFSQLVGRSAREASGDDNALSLDDAGGMQDADLGGVPEVVEADEDW